MQIRPHLAKTEFINSQDEYASQMPNHFVSIKDNEDAHSRIIKGKYAIIGKVIASIFVPEDEMKNEIFKVQSIMNISINPITALCIPIRRITESWGK